MDIVEELRQDREKGARRLVNEYKAGLMTLARRFCFDEGVAAKKPGVKAMLLALALCGLTT
ncbi:MAG: hypothetical protein IJP66_04450 [Kiritimatiellae bacterium]|nr:hypothetical protein [Kiritimatiellia bacterium]